ncbi:hypothetical protein NRF20_11705 [Streptomyces sp. R-74717]|uniref:hypothetical protein n=1 Tax=Streptomyces TaxID=1883 RepID=UPI0037A51D6F
MAQTGDLLSAGGIAEQFERGVWQLNVPVQTLLGPEQQRGDDRIRQSAKADQGDPGPGPVEDGAGGGGVPEPRGKRQLKRKQFAVRFAERYSGLIEMRADCAARLKCGRRATAQALARWSTEADAPLSGSSCPVAARRHHLLANDRCCSSPTASTAFGAACFVTIAPIALIAAGALSAACTWICR